MDKNFFKMAAIITVVIIVLSLISWVFSDEATTKSNQEFKKRVITEEQKVRQKSLY